VLYYNLLAVGEDVVSSERVSSVLQCAAGWCSVLQCVAVCCGVLLSFKEDEVPSE